MGKYMKKGKITGDVAVMEFPQSGLGVRTRAKTLALQPNPELSYLQLRSRRLEKPQFQLPPVPPPLPTTTTTTKGANSSGNNGGGRSSSGTSCKSLSSRQNQREGARFGDETVVSGSGSTSVGRWEVKEGSGNCCKLEPLKLGGGDGIKAEEFVEASFGENNFVEFDGTGGRRTRETTPCSLIREVDAVGTPRSSDVRSSVNRRRRVRAAAQQQQQRQQEDEETGHRERAAIPTTREMDDFFATAEIEQQRLFMEKYNFDVVNDSPLPGRYEWVRVNP